MSKNKKHLDLISVRVTSEAKKRFDDVYASIEEAAAEYGVNSGGKCDLLTMIIMESDILDLIPSEYLKKIAHASVQKLS